MKVSNKIIDQLGSMIAGDAGSAPYLTGPRLVKFFNEFSFDDDYYGMDGFPSRWRYAADNIRKVNGTDELRRIFEEFVDPRRYGGNEETSAKIAEEITALIKYDGFAIQKIGNVYKIVTTTGVVVQPEATKAMGHEFVQEQISKCQQKIISGDYAGAITNARSLVEAVLIDIIERLENCEVKNDGNLPNLWSRTKKALKIDMKKEELPEPVFQILAGLDTSLNGLAGLSNNASDRHANKFNTKRHHAKLAVNLAMTFCDFLIDVLNNKNQPV